MVLYALFYERYSKKLRPFVFALFFVFFFVYQAFLLFNEKNLPITPFFIHFFTQTSAQAPSRFQRWRIEWNVEIWQSDWLIRVTCVRYFILIGSPLYWPVIPLRILAFTTRKSESHSKLRTIFEAYREIVAFVISQYTLE